MDEYEALLRQIEQNDPAIDRIAISDVFETEAGWKFISPDCSVDFFARLGAALGSNTQVVYLRIHWEAVKRKVLGNAPFIEGFRRHSSCFRTLGIERCNLGGRIRRLLDCTINLEGIRFYRCFILDRKGIRSLASLIRSSTNLIRLEIVSTTGMRQYLQEIVEAIRECPRLNLLTLTGAHLADEMIGREKCEALVAPLLQDPATNLTRLTLGINNIDSDCTTILANSLVGNNKLWKLVLSGTGGDNFSTGDFDLTPFKKLLCDTTSMNATYSSNHTLRYFFTDADETIPDGLARFLQLNRSRNHKKEVDKKLVVVRKILDYHPSFNVESLFEWDMKALPLVVEWFEKARSFRRISIAGKLLVDNRKLCAIFQFVRAMPGVFEPAPTGTKRKHSEIDG